MKKSTFNPQRGKMKFSRLLLYLLLVSVFGFLNAFMSQNFGQKDQAGEKDRLNDVFRNELVMFTTPDQGEIPVVRL
jgi:hypothetical protein